MTNHRQTRRHNAMILVTGLVWAIFVGAVVLKMQTHGQLGFGSERVSFNRYLTAKLSDVYWSIFENVPICCSSENVKVSLPISHRLQGRGWYGDVLSPNFGLGSEKGNPLDIRGWKYVSPGK